MLPPPGPWSGAVVGTSISEYAPSSSVSDIERAGTMRSRHGSRPCLRSRRDARSLRGVRGTRFARSHAAGSGESGRQVRPSTGDVANSTAAVLPHARVGGGMHSEVVVKIKAFTQSLEGQKAWNVIVKIHKQA